MVNRADRIGKAIKEKGLSFAELERITGVSKSALQRYATGETKKIPIDVIEKVAAATGVSARYLMGWEETEEAETGNSVFWQVFYSECKKQGTSPNAVCKAIGLSNATATGWKNGTLPKADVLVKIADVLHVSVDYLLGRTDGEQMFFDLKQTVDEMRQKNAPDSEIKSVIANKINQLSDSQLDRLQGYLDALLSE